MLSYIKFIVSILFVVTTIFSTDYYPLKIDNYWISFGSWPLSPMSSCPSDTNHFAMTKIDSAIQIQNATVYIIGYYAVTENDTCLTKANAAYVLDSGNAIYIIDQYPNPTEQNCIGYHDYNKISNWVDLYGDTIVADYIGDTIIENISFHSCYSVHDKANSFCDIYAQNIGPVASFEDGELVDILKYYRSLSTGLKLVKKGCQGTLTNTNNFNYDLLGRKHLIRHYSMSLTVVKDKLTITKSRKSK